MALLPGDRLHGRYLVLRAIGRGGMASVHLVRDEPRGTELVLKELRAETPELLESFRAEFALLTRVASPFLTRVHDFGSETVRGELVHFYTAEWVEGRTLGNLAGTANPDQLLPALLDALEGLETLHALSVRHGDFTPDNVIVRPDGHGVLIDLGCARQFDEPSASVSGTPGFLPEELLLTGTGDAKSDLFAVGVTLEHLHRQASRKPSAALQDLISRLTDRSPDRRPESVHDVLDALGRRRTLRGKRLLSPGLFGRETELGGFDAWLAGVRAGSGGPRILLVHGAPGGGTTRLMREMLGRAELAQSVVRVRASDPDPLGFLLSAASGLRDLGASVRGALLAARALSARSEPLLLAFEDADRLLPDDADRLAAFARSLSDKGRVSLLVSGLSDIPGAWAASIPAKALDAATLERWTGGALSARAVRDLLRATDGLPAQIEAALSGSAGSTTDSVRVEASNRRERLAAALAQLKPGALSTLALLVALEGELDPRELRIGHDDAEDLLARGIVFSDGPRLRLALRDDLGHLSKLLPAKTVAMAHRRIVTAIDGGLVVERRGARAVIELIRHLTLSGSVAEAEGRFGVDLAALEGEPRLASIRLLPLLEVSRAPETLSALGDLALLAQEPERALAAAARALTLRPTKASPRARLIAADALVRLGRSERAERTALPLLKSTVPETTRAAAWVRVARARTQRGDHTGAEKAAAQGLALASGRETGVALREASGVAASYLGRTEEAVALFGALYDELGETGPARDRCRILGQRAIAAFRLGRTSAASEDHARALAIAESAGEDDLVAVCALNLGTTEQQAGHLGAALLSYERGLVVARAVGRVSTELTLRYNSANLRADIGAFESALSELELLGRRAEAAGFRQFPPAIALLRAEIALVRGDAAIATTELATAEAGFQEQGLARESVEAEIVKSEIALAEGDLDAALERVTDAARRAARLRAEDLELRAALSWGKIATARGDAAALPQLTEALERAHGAGHSFLEAKLATELLAAATRFDPSATFELGERARKLWEKMALDLPDELRRVFYEHPRRLALSRLTRVTRRTSTSEDSETLRRLLSLTRRLNSSLSLDRVLDYAVEAAVELTHAERGFLLLLGKDGEHAGDGEPRVAAARDAGNPTEPPSSSIVLRVIKTEEAVLTTDAETDPRFRGRGSVHAMRLKSVLCVPIATPSGPLGALYVDSRVQRGRFVEADRELLASLADHAAIAVNNARMHAELAAKAEKLSEQRVEIERLSRGKDREIVRLKEQVETRQRALELRYDYSQIVGRGPAMRKVLEQLDRIIDSTVNVLVEGESGTGKELVARAIHWNGARRTGPFVGVNCAALPEALLESELFGHVRGAFTSADRDKKGLLVEANGGTLFLDELGEMPLVTQAKLLRVIQEREVRPVGATRSVPFDVRLVCATHRDLVSEVAAGRFREDLYYRIAIVGVRLPALRERVEDIPELCRTILERLARAEGRPVPEIDAAALRLLSGQPWPGNVRQLENTLTRAFVLSPGKRLGAPELALTRRAEEKPARSRTRREYEAEERSRILDLLHRSRWNVSFVARTLGIPRNSFYRKLVRYGLTRGADATNDAPETAP